MRPIIRTRFYNRRPKLHIRTDRGDYKPSLLRQGIEFFIIKLTYLDFCYVTRSNQYCFLQFPILAGRNDEASIDIPAWVLSPFCFFNSSAIVASFA